jgi:hypothetical protein
MQMAVVPTQTKLLKISLNVRPTSMAVFRAVLTDKMFLKLCSELDVRFRCRFYTPLLTFWAFIAQVLDPDHSCRSAVTYALSWWRGGKAPGQRRNRKRVDYEAETGTYCKARKRLPEELMRAVVGLVGRTLIDKVPALEKMWDRDVYLTDGTCLSMPDEKALAEHFGRSSGGKSGSKQSRFPIARLVAVISMATGAVMDAAIGAYAASEHALFESLARGTQWLRKAIIVGDRLYGSFAHLAMLLAQETDVVSRLHGSRPADMRKGKRLGRGDRLITWSRPKKRPDWLDAAFALPETLVLRMIEVTALRRGYRPQRLILITTLTDPVRYPAEQIANLYLRRWDIELDLRHIKNVLQMDVLRGKTPDIVRKEIWAHLAAYNLVRAAMWEASAAHNFSPYGIELQGHPPTPQYLRAAHRKCPLFELVPEAA